MASRCTSSQARHSCASSLPASTHAACERRRSSKPCCECRRKAHLVSIRLISVKLKSCSKPVLVSSVADARCCLGTHVVTYFASLCPQTSDQVTSLFGNVRTLPQTLGSPMGCTSTCCPCHEHTTNFRRQISRQQTPSWQSCVRLHASWTRRL